VGAQAGGKKNCSGRARGRGMMWADGAPQGREGGGRRREGQEEEKSATATPPPGQEGCGNAGAWRRRGAPGRRTRREGEKTPAVPAVAWRRAREERRAHSRKRCRATACTHSQVSRSAVHTKWPSARLLASFLTGLPCAKGSPRCFGHACFRRVVHANIEHFPKE